MAKGAAGTDKATLLSSVMWNWFGFAMTAVITFLMAPLLIHGLGDTRYGVWSLVESVVGLLLLLEMGVGASIVRYVPKFEQEQDAQRLRQIYSTSLCILAGAGGCVLLITAGIAVFWPRPDSVPVELATTARWMIVILGIDAAVSLPLGVFPSVLYGLGRFPAKAIIEALTRIGIAVSFLVVLWQDGGLFELAVVILSASIVKGILSAIVVRYYLPDLRFSPRLINREILGAVHSYSWRAFVILISGRLSSASDAIVIGIFLSPQFITFYIVANRLIDYAIDFMRAATTVVTPVASASEAGNDRVKLTRLLMQGTRYAVYVAVPIQLGFLFMGHGFLTLWLDQEHANHSYPILVVLSLPLTLLTSQAVSSRILYGIGDLNWFSRVCVVQSMGNIALSVFLVRHIGNLGVAIGTAVPNTVVCLALLVYIARTLDVKIGPYAWHAYMPGIAAGAGLALVWGTIGRFVTFDASWLHLILVALAGLLTYAATVCVLEYRQLASLTFLQSMSKRFASSL